MRIPGKSSVFAILLIFPLVLVGCGYDTKSSSDINPSPSNKVDKKGGSADQPKNQKNASSDMSEQSAKTTARQLFLIDSNGHVTPQVFQLPEVKTTASQAIDYLVKGGPVSDLLPNGFEAVIPAGTTAQLNLDKDTGTLTVDFSKEFKNYQEKDEQKILQAITWTLTQFDTVDHVKLRVDGKALKAMPVGKTPIPSEGLSRADGINTDLGKVVDVTGSESVVVYYLSQNDKGQSYYVPVTQRVNTSGGKLAATINALLDGPVGDPTLESAFGPNVALAADPTVENGIAKLDFNESFYTDLGKKTVSDEAINCLALTLTGEKGIKKVAVEVKGKTQMTLDSGKSLTKPVSRPIVNQGKTGV